VNEPALFIGAGRRGLIAVRLLARRAQNGKGQVHEYAQHWTTSSAYSMLLPFGLAQLRNLPTTAARNE
jgi:hypothetical protein